MRQTFYVSWSNVTYWKPTDVHYYHRSKKEDFVVKTGVDIGCDKLTNFMKPKIWKLMSMINY
jgi:hypothetical protein